MLLTSFFIFLAVISKAHGIIVCSNQTITINPNQLEFFKLPDYPIIMSSFSNCYINFTVKNPSQRGRIYMTSMYLPTLSPTENIFDFQLIKKDSYLVTVADNLPSYTGFIIYDEWNDDDCMLESISRINPYYIKDVENVIYLRSSYYENQTRKHPCRWSFTAPQGYGFKIVIRELNINADVKVTAVNSTNYDIIGAIPKLVHPYYNEDNHLIIMLSKSASDTSNGIEFGALISIILNNPEIGSINCTTSIENDFTWHWYSPYTGYPINAKCSYNLTVNPQTEVFISSALSEIEQNVDTLTFYDAYDILTYISPSQNYILRPPNNTLHQYNFEFQSDGSIPGYYFDLVFIVTYCTCAKGPFIAPCNGSVNYFITDRPNIRTDVAFYCGNMKCNFSIQLDPKCSQKHVFALLTFMISSTSFNDVMKITSDQKVVLSIPPNIPQFIKYGVLLNTSNENVLEVLTENAPESKSMGLSLTAFDVPIILPSITLSKNSTYYATHATDLIENSIFTVQTEESKASIEIFSKPFFSFIELYTDNTMAQPVNKDQCFNSTLYQNYLCVINRSQVSTYTLPVPLQPGNPQLIFYQISRNARDDGCAFDGNVFYFNDYYNYNNDLYQKDKISAISNEKGRCKIFLISNDDIGYVTISSFWTTAKSNVLVYSGINEPKYIFEFNSTSASQWKNIVLYSDFYIFDIPPNSSLILSLCFYDVDAPSSCLFTLNSDDSSTISLIPNTTYNSIMTTPFYGDIQDDKISEYHDGWLRFEIINRKVEFTTIAYDISKNINFTFLINDTLQDMSEINKKVTIFTGNVSIFYYQADNIGNQSATDVSGVLMYYRVFKDVSENNGTLIVD